jgi:alkaline phosphatase D
MKKFLNAALTGFTLLFVFSCQSQPQTEANGSRGYDASLAKSRNDLVKAEKRKQSEADLPFRGLDATQSIQTIAFGSCADQDQPQPLWKTIEAQNPELFLFMGDNIYGSSKNQKPLSEQYRKLNRIAEYRSVREKVPFLAIWGDHDFGQNESGATPVDKEIARNEFLKYWTYLRTQLPKNQKALYHSKMIGAKKNTVQVIMLDTRWDRSDLKKNTDDENTTASPVVSAISTDATSSTPAVVNTPKNPRPYLADEDKSKHFLSEEQWNWLENELRKPAALRILVSSIQVIANDHQFEKWGNFPHERERLFNLLKTTKAKNLVILSGNRHAGSIAQVDVKGVGKVFDITASGLNNPAKPGYILKDSTYLKDAFPEVNFGLMKIDWSAKKALIELRSLDNSVVNSTEFKF